MESVSFKNAMKELREELELLEMDREMKAGLNSVILRCTAFAADFLRSRLWAFDFCDVFDWIISYSILRFSGFAAKGNKRRKKNDCLF